MVVKNFTTNNLLSDLIQVRFLILAIIIGGFMVSSVYADDSTEKTRAQISVMNVSLNPSTFESYDTGTLTCTIKNSGQNSVPIDRVTVYDKDIILTSREYDTTSWIGPGESRTYTFSLQARCGDGVYYPVLSVNSWEGGSLRYPVRLKVDSTKPVISIDKNPDTYAADKKETISISVSNPRENEIKNVHLIPSGDGIKISPTDSFLGTLQSGETYKASFDITPTTPADVTFTLTYSNGENTHETSRVLPVSFGYDKKQADPYVSNVILKLDDNGYHVTGDVTNAGMENAVSVVVTTTGDAYPIYPYKEYVVGTLKPDDFSSFELTFRAEGSSVIPIEIRYKDADGNQYTRSTNLDLTYSLKNNEDSGVFPYLFIVIVVIGIGGGLYRYRKKILPGLFR